MTSVAPRIANDVSCVTPINHESHFFRGRRNIWGCWRMTSVAPRIVNDVSCVTSINRESHFSWQAQCLVMLEDGFCCSARCK